MTDIRFIAKQYIDAGWAVVPLNAGEKRASVRWQNTVYKPSDFNDDSNIAIKMGDPSAGLVDVDCDHPFAVAAAKILLPATRRIFGRTSKPSSHYLFLCPGIKTTQFTDVKDSNGHTQTLVEVRSTAAYTMFPPSNHPSGDSVTWELEREVMERSPEEMYSDVRSVALATLIAIHYPDHGNKHFAIGQYLPGFLLQAKLDEMMVKHIIKTAANLVGDGDWRDREKAIDATIAKFRNGEPVAGGPKLTDSLGESVVAKMRAWLKMADLDKIEEMNARHFFVRLGKDSVIGREDDPEEIIFQTTGALRTEYANKVVQTGTDKDSNATFAPLFDTWLKSPTRRSYRRVVFSPPPISAPDDDFNLWRGFGVTSDVSDPKLVLPFLEHVRHIICCDDPEYYEYAMNLFARLVQRPGEAGQVAMVMKGPQGAGKGVIVNALGRIVGRSHYAHIVKSEQVIGRFNKAIGGKLVVFLDEAFWAGDKAHGALKALITEPTIMVEPKGIDPFSVDNFAHVFCATNEEWAWPADLGDRRGFVLKVADTYANNVCAATERKCYFTRLWSSLAHGGDAALLALLRARDLEEFDVFAVPNTEELIKQKLQTLRGVKKWLYDAVYSGHLIGQLSWPTTPVSNADLFSAYATWCDANHERKLSQIVFGRAVTKFLRIGGKQAQANAQGVKMGRLRTPDQIKKLLPPLDVVNMERIDLLWSNNEWTSMLVDVSTDDDING